MRFMTKIRARQVYRKLKPFLRTSRPGYRRARPPGSEATFRWMNPAKANGYRHLRWEEFLEVYGMVRTSGGYIYAQGDLPWFLRRQAV